MVKNRPADESKAPENPDPIPTGAISLRGVHALIRLVREHDRDARKDGAARVCQFTCNCSRRPLLSLHCIDRSEQHAERQQEAQQQ